jgi:small subunit ribosomal protein S4
MPRTQPRLKIIRRLGTPLPGLTSKVPPDDALPPGQHGAKSGRRKRSRFAERLREKQKVRFHYGVSETQLRHAYAEAGRRAGVVGHTLLALLESRLDSVVFRLGFAPTIKAARQLVGHGHIVVNGRRLDRPSARVQAGDTVAVHGDRRTHPAIVASVTRGPRVALPGYLALDSDSPYTGRMLAYPARHHIPFVVDETAIVEWYAR